MNNPNCKYCQSNNVIKYGSFGGIQRFWCKDCKRKFAANEALPNMKTPSKQIEDAMSMYFGGMPLDSIQVYLSQEYNNYLSELGIYNWIIRFSKEAIRRSKSFKSVVGDTWVADETYIKVAGKNIWFWDIIDVKSRYLLASHLSTSRTTGDARVLVEQAAIAAGKTPKVIVTDYLQAYIGGIEQAFGAVTIHTPYKPFTLKNLNNIIERFHGTLKDRMDVIRGFKNMGNARILTDAWLVHYNFFKEHEAFGNVPPAQKMGVKVPFKNWAEVVRGTVVPYKPIKVSTLKVATLKVATPDIFIGSSSQLVSATTSQTRRSPKRRAMVPGISSIRMKQDSQCGIAIFT